MTAFPDAQPHGPIEEIFPDVFVVRGVIRMGFLVSLARNMIVLREGKDLTLVNAVRLSEGGEAELAKLGDVKHLVKLGAFHTLDNPYCRDRYSPIFWTSTPPDPKCEKLTDGGAGPLKRASVFSFETAAKGEAALVLEQPEGNLLVTCDSVQNWVSGEGSSFIAGLVVRAVGLMRPAAIGPMWLNAMSNKNPAAMKPDFDRLLTRDWKHLIAGHGVLLKDDAKAALARSCVKTFGAA